MLDNSTSPKQGSVRLYEPPPWMRKSPGSPRSQRPHRRGVGGGTNEAAATSSSLQRSSSTRSPKLASRNTSTRMETTAAAGEASHQEASSTRRRYTESFSRQQQEGETGGGGGGEVSFSRWHDGPRRSVRNSSDKHKEATFVSTTTNEGGDSGLRMKIISPPYEKDTNQFTYTVNSGNAADSRGVTTTGVTGAASTSTSRSAVDGDRVIERTIPVARASTSGCAADDDILIERAIPVTRSSTSRSAADGDILIERTIAVPRSSTSGCAADGDRVIERTIPVAGGDAGYTESRTHHESRYSSTLGRRRGESRDKGRYWTTMGNVESATEHVASPPIPHRRLKESSATKTTKTSKSRQNSSRSPGAFKRATTESGKLISTVDAPERVEINSRTEEEQNRITAENMRPTETSTVIIQCKSPGSHRRHAGCNDSNELDRTAVQSTYRQSSTRRRTEERHYSSNRQAKEYVDKVKTLPPLSPAFSRRMLPPAMIENTMEHDRRRTIGGTKLRSTGQGFEENIDPEQYELDGDVEECVTRKIIRKYKPVRSASNTCPRECRCPTLPPNFVNDTTRSQRACSQMNIDNPMTTQVSNQWSSENNLRQMSSTYKQPPMQATYSAHRENQRRAAETLGRSGYNDARSNAGAEITEYMESYTLHPIGRGVQDIEPNVRHIRSTTPNLSRFHKNIRHREFHSSLPQLRQSNARGGTGGGIGYEGFHQSQTTLRQQDAARLGGGQQSGNASPFTPHIEQRPVPIVVSGGGGSMGRVSDLAKSWNMPNISRTESITLLRDAQPGFFVIRRSQTTPDEYVLDVKIPYDSYQATQDDITNHYVRHYVLVNSPAGIRLKDPPGQQAFSNLSHFVHYHMTSAGQLPCLLRLPDATVVDGQTNWSSIPPSPIISNAIVSDLLYLGSVEAPQDNHTLAIANGIRKILDLAEIRPHGPAKRCEVRLKVTATEGVVFVDRTKRTMLKKHFKLSDIRQCLMDPDDRSYNDKELQGQGVVNAKLFGLLVRKNKLFSQEQVVYVFSELELRYPVHRVVDTIRSLTRQSERDDHTRSSKATAYSKARY